MRPVPPFALCLGVLSATLACAEPTVVTVRPAEVRQEFQGLGCGAIFYEAHMTSLGDSGRTNEQEQLYDVMFRDVRTDFLQLMIRHDHEPVNDNDDPYTPAFDAKHFSWCRHPLRISEAAKRRNRAMKLHAVLYSPPAWMKTNNDPGGGGEQRGALKSGLELEFAEFIWAFLDHMRRHGQPIDYLSIANEPDWPHTQPSHFLSPDRHADLLADVGGYLDEMARRYPATPRPTFVAPNNLSAVDCAKKYLPPMLERAARYVEVVGCHDYDRRGHRWAALRSAVGDRPLWQTESCFNGHDPSPGLIRSATEHWLNMTEAFNEGVNVWMAYDWVYPPRQGGEALIHLNWGRDYQLTKIYHAFRQWSVPLAPGMRVIETTVTGPFASGIAQAGVKATAFVRPDRRRLVVHVAAVQDPPAEIRVDIGTEFAGGRLRCWRTSPDEDIAPLPGLALENGALRTSMPGRGMLTLVIDRNTDEELRP